MAFTCFTALVIVAITESLLFLMTETYTVQLEYIKIVTHPVLVNTVTDCILLQSSRTNTGLSANV